MLLEELAERKNLREIDYRNPINNNMTAEEVITTMTLYYVNEIYDTKLSMNQNIIQRIYNRLNSTKNVEVYATGMACYVGTQFIHKIAPFGFQCRLIEFNSDFPSRFSNNEDKVAILICLNDDDLIINNMARQLSMENAYMFGILNENNEYLKKICKDYIVVSHSNNEQNISTVCGALYVIDIIYSMFLSYNK